MKRAQTPAKQQPWGVGRKANIGAPPLRMPATAARPPGARAVTHIPRRPRFSNVAPMSKCVLWQARVHTEQPPPRPRGPSVSAGGRGGRSANRRPQRGPCRGAEWQARSCRGGLAPGGAQGGLRGRVATPRHAFRAALRTGTQRAPRTAHNHERRTQAATRRSVTPAWCQGCGPWTAGRPWPRQRPRARATGWSCARQPAAWCPSPSERQLGFEAASRGRARQK